MRILIRAARAAAARYRTVPASVVYPQLFLAFGWIRASLAHSLSLSWWSGEEVLRFLEANEELRLPVYEPIVDFIILPAPALIAAVVVILQTLIGVALLLNIRPVRWILAGIFLNANFMMAGQVNPSVFYVVMALAVVLWIMWDRMKADNAYRVAIRSTVLAAAAIVICGPFVTTLDPAQVIEDPSLVIIILSLLFAASTWMMFNELMDGENASPQTATAEAMPAPSSRVTQPPAGKTLPRPNGVTRKGARRSAVLKSTSLETDLQELRAASPAEIMEAMDRPIPRLPSQGTMSYHEDVDSGFSINEPPEDEKSQNGASLRRRSDQRQSIANFEVSSEAPKLNWYSVRCHFRVDEQHYEERITVWQAVGFDDAIDLAETEADGYATKIDGEYLGSCDCFHLPDTGMKAVQGAEIYSLVRASDLDADTYLRTFFFTGTERSAEV